MPGNFYEILGTPADASPEDIKRAYRKKALQTHPDRLPQGATPEDKKTSEEQFRNVNNAYEILMDPKKRKLYDLYGVWPPPEEFPEEPRRERDHPSGSRHPHRPPPADHFDDFFDFPFSSPFGDPFARHQRSRPPVFRDPFELFQTMFADMQHDLYYGPNPLFTPPPDPFWGRSGPVLGRPPAEIRPSLFPHAPIFRPFLDFPAFPDERPRGSSRPDHRDVFSFESSSREFYGSRGSNSPQWVSEQRMIRTINGVTQSVLKREDRDGNEHVTYTYPDGRKQYTLNGVEQPHPTHHIQDASSSSASSMDSQDSSLRPVIPPEKVDGPSKKRWWNRH